MSLSSRSPQRRVLAVACRLQRTEGTHYSCPRRPAVLHHSALLGTAVPCRRLKRGIDHTSPRRRNALHTTHLHIPLDCSKSISSDAPRQRDCSFRADRLQSHAIDGGADKSLNSQRRMDGRGECEVELACSGRRNQLAVRLKAASRGSSDASTPLERCIGATAPRG